MNNLYSPEHSQHRRRSAYNVTQTIFTSSGRRQLKETNSDGFLMFLKPYIATLALFQAYTSDKCTILARRQSQT